LVAGGASGVVDRPEAAKFTGRAGLKNDGAVGLREVLIGVAFDVIALAVDLTDHSPLDTVETPITRLSLVVLEESRTASSECPPSRVTRRRECTRRYPCPIGVNGLDFIFSGSSSPSSSLSLSGSGVGRWVAARTVSPLGARIIAWPVRNEITWYNSTCKKIIHMGRDVEKPTLVQSSSMVEPVRDTWSASNRNHFGEEKRWTIINEQRSRNFVGTTVGS
jgi:hypothetical protein